VVWLLAAGRAVRVEAEPTHPVGQRGLALLGEHGDEAPSSAGRARVHLGPQFIGAALPGQQPGQPTGGKRVADVEVPASGEA